MQYTCVLHLAYCVVVTCLQCGEGGDAVHPSLQRHLLWQSQEALQCMPVYLSASIACTLTDLDRPHEAGQVAQSGGTAMHPQSSSLPTVPAP